MSVVLNDLPFVDVYVRLDQHDKALYRSLIRADSKVSLFVPPEFQDSINRFADAIKEKMGDRVDGAITFEGVRCRLSRSHLSDGTTWVCARRINTVLPDINKLNLPSEVVNHMLGLGKRDGLILISGPTGHGKTTTAVALLSYYLKTYGGTAVTIEDPCEFIMHGRHGEKGQCFQNEVEKEEDWALGLKRAMRWAPNYIYVGEIRTPAAAEQLLRAATTGHLVMTTVHAGAMEEALMGIVFLAEQSMGSGVHNMLATGLTALVNQSMGEAGMNMKYVFTEENAPGDPIRALIREDKIGMMSTYVDRAAARLSMAAERRRST
ncbi:MAG: type IV pilus twitching motility protein PilT [Alphaproteobacteria bacterium]|nr:type IV pilus twitching motility protein PilT [Alphaproteobacteria bacterium]MCL2505485.1 type IV pilus twitching motility protein PilT [Alphaproteobacteria bacterium]